MVSSGIILCDELTIRVCSQVHSRAQVLQGVCAGRTPLGQSSRLSTTELTAKALRNLSKLLTILVPKLISHTLLDLSEVIHCKRQVSENSHQLLRHQRYSVSMQVGQQDEYYSTGRGEAHNKEVDEADCVYGKAPWRGLRRRC
jgi:hypothetical protein